MPEGWYMLPEKMIKLQIDPHAFTIGKDSIGRDELYNVRPGQTFKFVEYSNPTTGYDWMASADP